MQTQSFLRALCRSLGFVVLMGYCVSVYAVSKPPPVLCIDDEDCVETQVAEDNGGSGGSYTFGSIGSVPFSYATPVAPNTTSEVNVTPGTFAANLVSGRRLVLSPGNYGDRTFGVQDIEFVLQPGAVLGRLAFTSSAARLKFTSTSPRAGVISYIDIQSTSTSDILFDGVTQVHVGGGNKRNFMQGRRLAIINSDLTTSAMVLYSVGGSDLVLANNRMLQAYPGYFGESGASDAAIRLHGVQRLVFVDNFLTNLPIDVPNDRHSFRIHGSSGGATSDNLYIANNIFVGPGTGVTSASHETDVNRVWWENNVHHVSPGLMLMIVENSNLRSANQMIIRNNAAYGSAGNTDWPNARSGWTVQNNASGPWQNPPNWSFK